MEITFIPQNRKVNIEAEESVLTAALKAKVFVESNCGGRGNCGKCKVKVISGTGSSLLEEESNTLSEEEKRQGYRLACRLYAMSDLVVELNKQDHNGEVRKAIKTQLPNHFVYKPRKSQNDALTSTNNEESKIYGIAFDIGTTSVVGLLWNLTTGEYRNAVAQGNLQRVYGADVISRIEYSLKGEEELKELKNSVLKSCEGIIEELVEKEGIKNSEIRNVVMVGNSTMSHLFLGIAPTGLSRSPFKAGFEGSVRVAAHTLFPFLDKKAELMVMPNIAGHVGSDITAGILATLLYEVEGLKVFIDIGTNGEIVVVKNKTLYTCSTAAGPAFEGASIKHGMRAENGAIESVWINEGVLSLEIIGDGEAKGICGSGLIDAVAQLCRTGIVDETGLILDKDTLREQNVSEELIARIVPTEKGNDFILSYLQGGEDIRITQTDIREVQLAKAAIYAGIVSMLRYVNGAVSDLDEILIAGAFGNYIKKDNAVRIGLLPNIPMEQIKLLGNTASVGASMALLSDETEQVVESFLKTIRHVELANESIFMGEYIEAMNFPKA